VRALLLTLLLTSGLAAAAPARARVVVRAPELSGAQRQKVLAAGRAALETRTSFLVETIEPAGTAEPGQPPCRTEACLLEAARATNAELALILDAAVPELVFELRASFVDVGTGRVSTRMARGGSPDTPDESVALLLDTVLPEWTRKGHASVWVSAPADAVVKVDGRRVGLTPLPEPLSLPAGAHEVDVMFASGQGVLWTSKLAEGERLALEAAPSPAFEGLKDPAPRGGVLPPISYGLWTAGAVAVATSLVVGGIVLGTTDDLAGCTESWRGCNTLDEVGRIHRRAESNAQAANILLYGGAALGLSGAGLFVFDLVGEGP
jgi:hypothetical protein